MGRIPELEGHQHQPDEVATPPEVAQTWEETVAAMMRHEAAEWQRTLGAEVDVPPVPDSITAEVLENLRANNFQLVYIPALDLRPPGFVIDDGTQDPDHSGFLARIAPHLEMNTPNLLLTFPKKYDEDVDWNDTSNYQNLDAGFFGAIHNGYTDFPKTTGEWVVIENGPMIYPGVKDPSPTLFALLSLGENRFMLSNNEIQASLQRNNQNILNLLGLKAGTAQVPGVVPLNLMANRLEWCTNEFTCEHTSTPTVSGDDRLRSYLAYSLNCVDGVADDLPEVILRVLKTHCRETGISAEEIQSRYHTKEVPKTAYHLLGVGAGRTGYALASTQIHSARFRVLVSNLDTPPENQPIR